MLRNEALLLLPAMLGGNADLQKIVAFSGAFEKLFEIIAQEGGADGGIVVQDALTVVGCLLRFNVSNQVSFSGLVFCGRSLMCLELLQRISSNTRYPANTGLPTDYDRHSCSRRLCVTVLARTENI